jgi:hypothetical protein
MSTSLLIGLALAALYLVFLFWYGGRGAPLTQTEIDQALGQLEGGSTHTADPASLEQLRTVLSHDDGREFVMHNLVRWRSKALYPPGSPYGDDVRAADKRYGRAIVWPLIKRAGVVMMIARNAGRFIDDGQSLPWTYVAMVRYRSRRDFLRFVVETEQREVFVHKWAAIEHTHVFPVQPIISLFGVRLMAGMALCLAAIGLIRLFG